MNVLFLSFTYYPDINGVQYVTQYQAEGLASLGHRVEIITSNHSNNEESSYIYNSVAINRINMWTSNMIHYGNKYEYNKLLLDRASHNDIVIFVCPESWATDCALSVVNKITCAKALMVHGIHEFKKRRDEIINPYGIVKRMIGNLRWWPYYHRNWSKFKSFDVVFQLDQNDFGYKYFARHRVKSKILHNAVEDVFFETVTSRRRRIINVGTFHRSKNQVACLEAFYQSNLDDYELVLIGPRENKYQSRLLETRERLEGELGHRKVSILAGLGRPDTVRLIKGSQIYLLTSVTEMQPVSLLEAMASGAAFVSTDVGINRYLPGGLIRDTPEDMARALEYLADEDRWRVYGGLGREYALSNCRMKTQVRRLESALLEAVERHGAG